MTDMPIYTIEDQRRICRNCVEFLTKRRPTASSVKLKQVYVEQLYVANERLMQLTISQPLTPEILEEQLDNQLAIYDYGQNVQNPYLETEMLDYTAYKNIFNIASLAHRYGVDDVLENTYPVLLQDQAKKNLLTIKGKIAVTDSVLGWVDDMCHEKTDLPEKMNICETIGRCTNDWRRYEILGQTYYKNMLAKNIDRPKRLLELFDKNMRQSHCPFEHLLQLQILGQCVEQQSNHADLFNGYKKALFNLVRPKYIQPVTHALAGKALDLN